MTAQEMRWMQDRLEAIFDKVSQMALGEQRFSPDIQVAAASAAAQVAEVLLEIREELGPPSPPPESNFPSEPE